MGKPVIVTDTPANRQVVGDSKFAVYVSSADPAGFCSAFMNLHENYKMLQQWGPCGRTLIKLEYEWSIVAEHLENYLATRRVA